MKYTSILLAVISIMFCSCNRNNEPDTEFPLSIIETYMPHSVAFDKTDTEFLNECREWNNKTIIVNSADELPDDPLGFNDSYRKIAFKEYSLLLTYRLHAWSIDTYRNMFVKNNVENTFNWTISIGSNDIGEDHKERVMITRFAILVRKLPEDAKLQIWWSITDMGFDWTDVK